MARGTRCAYHKGMERSERIAELGQRIGENAAWRAAWTNGTGTSDPTEFHRRGDELNQDRQELDLLKDDRA